MSEQRNLDKVSIQDLEKEKLQAEIDILKGQLAKEFPEEKEKSPGWFEKISVHAKGWSALLLGAVTLFSAIWGVFVPLSQYLDEQKKALEFALNENMIGFVEDLNDSVPAIANRGVMMLSYYEMNSVPILLFFLETSENNQEEFREKIIETIALIYSGDRGTKIVDGVALRIMNSFNQIVEEHTFQDGQINNNRRVAILNYLELIEGLKLRSHDRNQVELIYTEIRSKICADKTLEDNILSIHWQISDYLGASYDCNEE